MRRFISATVFFCILASLVLFASALTATSQTQSYTLTDGVEETQHTMSGGQKGYMLQIAPNADVMFKTSYANYFTKGSTVSSRAQTASSLGIQTKVTTAHAADYELATGRDVIFATNANFFYSDTHETRGFMMVEGTEIQKNSSDCVCYFAILKDGSYDIRNYTEDTSDVYEAVAGRQWLVRNGVQVKQNAELLSARTAIGLKADGTVVVFIVDGKTGVSGTTINDMSELMFSLGCVEAINLDGGGSSTFVSQRSEQEALTIRNKPSDATGEREVVSTLLLVKTEPLFFDFTNDAAAQLRYTEKTYGNLNYDTANWHYHHTYTTEPIFNSEAGTLSFTTTTDCPPTRNIHTIITSSNTSFTGGHPLSYTPTGKDYFKIRMKIENSPDTAINFRLKYAEHDSTSSDFIAYNCTIPAKSVNQGYFVLEGLADFGEADLVTALRPEVYNLLIPDPQNTQVTFTIDYIYLGAEAESEEKTELFFDFSNDADAKSRYNSLTYGFFPFDQSKNGYWATGYNGSNSAFSIDNTKGTISLDVTDAYSGSSDANKIYGPWLKTTNTYGCFPSASKLEYMPLLFTPTEAEVMQIRLQTSNCKTDAGKTPRVVFEYYYTLDGVRGYKNDIRADFSTQDGEYQILTIPVSASFQKADRIHGIGLRFQNILSDSVGKITIDYIYIGAKTAMPMPQYEVNFVDGNGNTLFTQNVYKGGSATYQGATPTKAYDSTNHYTFKAWDKALTNITADTTFTATFTATAHTFSYSKVDATNHKASCNCGYSKNVAHTWNSGVVTTEATCTTAGVKTFTCSACKTTRTESVPVKGHTEVIDKAVAATCTTAGKTEGKHCETCGEVLVAQNTVAALGHTEVVDKAIAPTCTETGMTEGKHCEACGEVLVARGILDALGHAPVYADNGNKTHTITCKNCDYSEIINCAFENGECICGAKEVVEPIYDDAVKFSHSLTLENDISINFIGLGSALIGYDSFYLECKVPVYNGNELVGYKTVNIEPVYNGKNYECTLLGVTAKMMNDEIEAVFRMTKDGQEYYSKIDVYSVAEYAYGKLDSTKATDTAELKVICANLLHYGSMAQTQFNYRTDALVDAEMTATHMAYLTDLSKVEMKDYRKQINDLDTVIVPWKSTTLELGNKVIMCLIANLANYAGEPSELTMRLSYTDANGVTVTEERPLTLYNPEALTYAVSYDGLRATEMRTIVSAAIYRNGERVSKTVEYSIESYGARSTDPAMQNLCRAMLAYGDSANVFFSTRP